MIGFMLDDTRRVVARVQLDALAVTVPRADLDFPGPRHSAADVGNAQAAFPVLFDLRTDRRDLGIDDRDRLAGRLARIVMIEAGDKQPHALAHLRRGQTNAVILDHRLDHVVDQLLDDRIANVAALERPRLLAKHRVTHARDLQDRHIPGIILFST